MDIITDTVRIYDIVAIQEVRNKSETALSELVELVNFDGSQYDYALSEGSEGQAAKNSMLTFTAPRQLHLQGPRKLTLNLKEQVLSTGNPT
jgi:kynureninase